jgi:hypothetical protein
METPLDFQETQPKPNNQFKIIAGINLGILLLYIVAIGSDPYLAGKAILIVFQVMLNLIIGIVCLAVGRWKPFAKSFFLSSMLVLLVGFGACLAREEIKNI